MKRVYVAANSLEAEVVRGFLEAQGIPAVVRGQYIETLQGEVPFADSTRPSVWVLDDRDYAEARRLIAERGGAAE